MASNAELVPIRVPKVGAIVIGMVLRAKPRQAFAGAAVRQGDLMRRPNSGPGRSCEPNHLAVPGVMRLPVMGLANDKEWALPVCAMPSRPRLVRLTEPHCDAKAVHDGTVEIQGPVEIADAHENMRKHVGSLACLKGGFWPLADESTSELLKVICYSDGGPRLHSNQWQHVDTALFIKG